MFPSGLGRPASAPAQRRGRFSEGQTAANLPLRATAALAAGAVQHKSGTTAAAAQQSIQLLPKPQRVVHEAQQPNKKLKNKNKKGFGFSQQQRASKQGGQRSRTPQQQDQKLHQHHNGQQPQQAQAHKSKQPQHQDKQTHQQGSKQEKGQQGQPQRQQQDQEMAYQPLKHQHLQRQQQGPLHDRSAQAADAAAIEQSRQSLAAVTLGPSSNNSRSPVATSSSSASKDVSTSRSRANASAASTSPSSSSTPHAVKILYKLPPHACREYKAAGVVLYDYDESSASPVDAGDIRVLLVREQRQVYTLPAGKFDSKLDKPHRPESTAARELEEETHGLIPAAVSEAVLPKCPQYYWRAGKMVMYFVRCKGGQQLPDLAAARLAAGKGHKAAAKVDQLSWKPWAEVKSGKLAGGTRKKRNSTEQGQILPEAASPAPAAAVEGELVAGVAAAESPDPSSVLTPSSRLVADAALQQEQQHEQQQTQAAEVGTIAQADPAVPQQQQEDAEEEAEEQEEEEGEEPQQQAADTCLALRRPTLVLTSGAVAKWLGALVTGQHARPGLLIQPVQQQEGSAAVDLLQAPVVQALPAAAVADVPSKAGVDNSGRAGTDDSNAPLNTDSSSGLANSEAGESHTIASTDVIKRVGETSSVLSAAAAVSAATAAALQAAGVAVAGSGGPSTGVVGEQPWALSLWSGRHEREMTALTALQPLGNTEREEETKLAAV